MCVLLAAVGLASASAQAVTYSFRQPAPGTTPAPTATVIKNYGAYRSWSDGSLAASCKAYQTGAPDKLYSGDTGDGVYRLDIGGTPTNVYCDMTTDGGGWMMVLKHPKGLTTVPYTVWNGNTAYPGTTPDKTTPEMVFVPSLLTTNWANTTEARVELIKNGTAQRYIKFSTAGKDKITWFAKANVSSTSWTDVTSSSQNYFSIQGDSANYRGWFINNLYNGCPADYGWLVVTYNAAKDTCSQQNYWQSAPAGSIMYATGTTKSLYANMAFADALVVLLR